MLWQHCRKQCPERLSNCALMHLAPQGNRSWQGGRRTWAWCSQTPCSPWGRSAMQKYKESRTHQVVLCKGQGISVEGSPRQFKQWWCVSTQVHVSRWHRPQAVGHREWCGIDIEQKIEKTWLIEQGIGGVVWNAGAWELNVCDDNARQYQTMQALRAMCSCKACSLGHVTVD